MKLLKQQINELNKKIAFNQKKLDATQALLNKFGDLEQIRHKLWLKVDPSTDQIFSCKRILNYYENKISNSGESYTQCVLYLYSLDK